ncbi:ester cyclase [Kitasatospora sp. NPDC052896]|uniref:ester cyclase n=1 Tax=Kitasatospora sp. NPDC052896 TaxID=3364061 RepID=UPI0037CAE45B
MTTTAQQTNSALYQRFLDAFNVSDYAEIAKVIAPDFEDHHSGFDIRGIDAYQAALRNAHETLAIRGELEQVLEAGDKVVTRVRLTGKHVGTVLGFPATGREVSWDTTEIWRVADGMFVERWATDDLLGLREQLSPEPANVELVRRVSEVVNARQYDAMDELFAENFVDRNPAWSVESLEQLKGIIIAAHDALDFTAHLDALYAADGDKVIMHITFTGRHIAPFFGIEPTGKEVTWTSLEVYRVEDNKVVERWVQADTAGLMAQIGVPLPQ